MKRFAIAILMLFLFGFTTPVSGALMELTFEGGGGGGSTSDSCGSSYETAKVVQIHKQYDNCRLELSTDIDYFRFDTLLSGDYVISSPSSAANTRVVLYDENKNYVAQAFHDVGNLDFSLTVSLDAYSTYYFKIQSKTSDTGLYHVNVAYPLEYQGSENFTVDIHDFFMSSGVRGNGVGLAPNFNGVNYYYRVKENYPYSLTIFYFEYRVISTSPSQLGSLSEVDANLQIEVLKMGSMQLFNNELTQLYSYPMGMYDIALSQTIETDRTDYFTRQTVSGQTENPHLFYDLIVDNSVGKIPVFGSLLAGVTNEFIGQLKRTTLVDYTYLVGYDNLGYHYNNSEPVTRVIRIASGSSYFNAPGNYIYLRGDMNDIENDDSYDLSYGGQQYSASIDREITYRIEFTIQIHYSLYRTPTYDHTIVLEQTFDYNRSE